MCRIYYVKDTFFCVVILFYISFLRVVAIVFIAVFKIEADLLMDVTFLGIKVLQSQRPHTDFLSVFECIFLIEKFYLNILTLYFEC